VVVAELLGVSAVEVAMPAASVVEVMTLAEMEAGPESELAAGARS
jgi:hypothetical protein